MASSSSPIANSDNSSSLVLKSETWSNCISEGKDVTNNRNETMQVELVVPASKKAKYPDDSS